MFKILIYGLNFTPELVGIGKYTGELAEELTRRGHRVTVVTTPPYYPHWRVQPGYTGRRYRVETLDGVRVVRCPLYVPGQVTGLKRVLHLCSFALSSFAVLLREARSRPDVVLSIAPALVAAPAAVLAGKRSNALAWLHIQDFEVDAALELGILKNRPLVRAAALRFESWVYRGFDRVSTISSGMAGRLAEKGVPREKLVLFPNWVDASEIFPDGKENGFRQSLGLNNGELVVLYSGSMGEKQGLEVLVGAAGLLRRNSDLHFVLCGEGPAKARLQAAAAGVANVHFLPLQPVERLNELLNLADVHVLPQKRGAADLVMPSKLLGTLASGKPVVAGCLPGSELYRVVSRVGVPVAPEDAPALAGALESLAADAARRASLGKKGREFVVENFSKTAVIDRFIALCPSRTGTGA